MLVAMTAMALAETESYLKSPGVNVNCSYQCLNYYPGIRIINDRLGQLPARTNSLNSYDRYLTMTIDLKQQRLVKSVWISIELNR